MTYEIDEICKVKLGGVNQKIHIRGEKKSNPVLLFLHGGPGVTNRHGVLARHSDLCDDFTIVCWDQRGTGGSYWGVKDESLNLNQLIEDAAERLGIDIIDAKVHDARIKLQEFEESADRVLADVPCSGLGVVHKKPDIKWKRKETDIEELCKLQKDILETAAAYVKKGGTLVYSTCTILPEENRLRIDEFLECHTEFRKVYEEQILTTDLGESGFYICKMVKG